MARACADGSYFEINDNGELTMVPGSMGLRTILYFNQAGTYTFTKAKFPWLARVKVRVQGAGGGSAAANAANGECMAQPGAAGGGYSESLIAASSLGATETIVVGAGGAAGTTTQAGGAGGSSSFGGFVVANGGDGGPATSTSGTSLDTHTGASGPVAGKGDWKQGGDPGSPSIRLNATNAVSGAGGDAVLGFGGQSRAYESDGGSGRGAGGGAGGALSFGGSVSGTAGQDGAVIIELYA
ncbi:hypothetical protein ABT301_29660 [Streptomyces sp. NPDC000987]|uniref:glycine-rich domain-containing protein n=1 Tax=Streptomyces sp. NPDC000987 TaxID=3154374 RepID=UPI003323F01F